MGPSMRLLRSVELPLSRIVMSRDLRFVQLNMNLSAGPSRKSMTSVMMLLNVPLSRMRSVMIKLLVTLLSPSAPSGPERFAVFQRKMLKSIHQSLDVPKEVCTRSRTNPRKVKKPVVKKWCYVATEESGLAEEDIKIEKTTDPS